MELLHELIVPGRPLNVTLLFPCVAPNPPPRISTLWPTVPDAGFKPVMLGDVTVKFTPFVETPPVIVTTTFPESAPKGTGTTIVLGPQEVGVAKRPLKLTWPLA